jgi:hypothetical protein
VRFAFEPDEVLTMSHIKGVARAVTLQITQMYISNHVIERASLVQHDSVALRGTRNNQRSALLKTTLGLIMKNSNCKKKKKKKKKKKTMTTTSTRRSLLSMCMNYLMALYLSLMVCFSSNSSRLRSTRATVLHQRRADLLP